MKVKKIHLATLSDIHLSSRRNSTSEIIANLRGAIGDNAETAQLDLIFLAGDIFDDLILLSHDDVVEIDLWIYNLLQLCQKHDILLRVLEGTPRHDWGQSKRFDVINEVMGNPVDLKYFTTISIEHIERFGIDVLYVPDEANPTPEMTLKVVRELIRAKGLDQVDFAIMHGNFDYQLPYLAKDHKHDSQAYLALVKHLIFIGHVHTFSQLERITAQGSFDRLSHGQEEKKGHVRATVWDDGQWEVKFVENKGAKKFITLKCTQDSLEETLVEIDRLVKTLPPHSYIRLDLSRDHPLLVSLDTLIRRYPFMNWEKIVRDGEEEEEEEMVKDDEDEYVPITITPENIVEMVMGRIVHHPDITNAVLECAEALLKGVVR